MVLSPTRSRVRFLSGEHLHLLPDVTRPAADNLCAASCPLHLVGYCPVGDLAALEDTPNPTLQEMTAYPVKGTVDCSQL
jgi:hypothetical protein